MKFRISIACLIMLVQFFMPGESFGQGLDITMCEGGIGTLTIPDCDDADDCCVVWYDNDLPEGENEVGHSCSLGVIYPTADKSYRIIITKDNFGSKEELTATVTIINQEDINVTLTPHKCYSKGQTISVESIEVQSNTEGLDISATYVNPSTAPFFDQEVASSTHQVGLYIPACAHLGQITKPVDLTVVNPDKRTTNFNPQVLFDPSQIIDKINDALKFLKIGVCSPYVGLTNEVKKELFNLCCKNSDPEGEIVVGKADTYGAIGELGIKCGKEESFQIPFIAEVKYGAFVGAGVELAFSRLIETSCEVDNGRKCFAVGLTPKFFGEAFGEIEPSYPGSTSLGIETILTGSFKSPPAKFCTPENKWILEEGPLCFEVNLQVNVMTNSFYIKGIDITKSTKNCSK